MFLSLPLPALTAFVVDFPWSVGSRYRWNGRRLLMPIKKLWKYIFLGFTDQFNGQCRCCCEISSFRRWFIVCPCSTIMLIEFFFSFVSQTARRRRIRYGIKFCDTGCTKYQAHVRTFRSLSTQLAGKDFTREFLIAQFDFWDLTKRNPISWKLLLSQQNKKFMNTVRNRFENC